MKWTPKISSRGEVRHGKSDLLSSLRVSDVSMQSWTNKSFKTDEERQLFHCQSDKDE
jgi:hypothetical protein